MAQGQWRQQGNYWVSNEGPRLRQSAISCCGHLWVAKSHQRRCTEAWCWYRQVCGKTNRRILDSMFLQLKTRLTHEVLCTLMAEVTAIINARPLLPVSADPEQPFILSPSVQETGVPPPPGDFSDKDLYTKQWRQVQALANQFWTRWSCEYLPCLQHRQKWTVPRRNLQVGDVVLLRDKQISPQLLAHGQSLCRIPWKGWICKKGWGHNNWPRPY